MGRILVRNRDDAVIEALRRRAAGREETIDRPAGTVRPLVVTLEDMASGRAVTIMPQNAELTTQWAAEFLNVSRAFLIHLVQEKKVPCMRLPLSSAD